MLRSFPKRSLFAGSVAGAASLCGLPVVSAAHPATDIVVKNWSFTPATVEAHVGEPTVLRFSSSEGVHGVEAADIGLAKAIITPGKVSEVTFTPKKEGTFAVHCAVVCGEGHDKMVLTVKVVK